MMLPIFVVWTGVCCLSIWIQIWKRGQRYHSPPPSWKCAQMCLFCALSQHPFLEEHQLPPFSCSAYHLSQCQDYPVKPLGTAPPPPPAPRTTTMMNAYQTGGPAHPSHWMRRLRGRSLVSLIKDPLNLCISSLQKHYSTGCSRKSGTLVIMRIFVRYK